MGVPVGDGEECDEIGDALPSSSLGSLPGEVGL